MNKRNLINLALFQGAWFAAVGGAAAGWPWLGPVATALWLPWHLRYYTDKPIAALPFLLGCGAAGFVADSVLVLSGLLDFPPAARLGWPSTLWMAALWVNLAMTARHSLGWLRPRRRQFPVAALLFGAFGGPAAYYAGAAMGAVALPHGMVSLACIGLLWGLALPAMFYCAGRFGH